MASEEGNNTAAHSLTKIPSSLHHQPPQLRYFVVRDNGNMVPLIPADELPYSVRLEGVQRVMSTQNASGMTMVGTLPFTGRFFRVDNSLTQRSTTKTPPTLRINNLLTRPNLSGTDSWNPLSPAGETLPQRSLPPSATAATWRARNDGSANETQAKIDRIVASEPQALTTKNSGTTSEDSLSSPKSSPDASNKVYCAYWIRNGECDYTQQGCRYKHEMPDKAGLESIGFKSVPRWWQERTKPVISSKEWLKRRPSDDGSASEDSESEAEEEGEQKRSADGQEDQAAASQEEEEVDHAPSKGAADTPTTGTSDKENEPAQTNSKEPRLAKLEIKARQPSLTGDLIDLSPTSPKATLAHTVPAPAPNAEPTTTTSGIPATPGTKQCTFPTRKVFVPPGESQELHIAESRKYARSQERKDNDRRQQSKASGSWPSQKHQQAVTPKVLLRRSESPGLMASMHAPTNARTNPRKPHRG